MAQPTRQQAPTPREDAPSQLETGMPVATTSAEIMRSDQHHDVFALCIACLARWCAKAGGKQLLEPGNVTKPQLFSWADFKTTWRDLNFSHIYAGKPKSCSTEGYMQQLFDACFQVAVMKMAVSDVERIMAALRGAGAITDANSSSDMHGMDGFGLTTIFNERQEVKDRLALFALWALHRAQPNQSQSHQMVLIRVEERYFDIIERWTGYVETANESHEREDLRDFVQVYASLWKQDAFCFGANVGFTPFSASHHLLNKETDKERALARDLRFHLSSTLRGMGVGTLEQLCGEYGSALRDVLVHAEEYEDSEHPLGIVDLEFGSELKRLVDVQSQKIHCSLYGEGAEGRFFAGLGKTTSSKRPGQSAQASVNKVLQREKARKLDIRQKKRLMEEAIGLDSDDGKDDDGAERLAEDMPDLLDGLEDLIPNDGTDDA